MQKNTSKNRLSLSLFSHQFYFRFYRRVTFYIYLYFHVYLLLYVYENRGFTVFTQGYSSRLRYLLNVSRTSGFFRRLLSFLRNFLSEHKVIVFKNWKCVSLSLVMEETRFYTVCILLKLFFNVLVGYHNKHNSCLNFLLLV